MRAAVGGEHEVAAQELGAAGVPATELVHAHRQSSPVELHLENVVRTAPLAESLLVHRRQAGPILEHGERAEPAVGVATESIEEPSEPPPSS